MKTNILRTFVVTAALAVVVMMAVSSRKAYSQSSGTSGGCCMTPSTNTNSNGVVNPLNCGVGYHQIGTGVNASCASDTANNNTNTSGQ
jgi:hypothetical protein